MLNIPSKLRAREEPVRIGIVGAGLFGTKVADQLTHVPGMTVAGVADIELDKAEDAFIEAGVEDPIERVESASTADTAIEQDKRVVLTDGCLLAETGIDVIVEATGVANAAARHAYKAIREGKHVVNVTIEMDTVVGPTLADLAGEHGVTYSLAYGDQPALMVELYDWARTIGMDVVAIGRGSVYVPESRLGTPDDAFERFGYDDQFVEEYGLNPKMYNSFLDGTKMSVEMCALANAIGLEPDVQGMHTPTAEPEEVPELLRPKANGGILQSSGVVETISSRHPDGSTTAHDLSWSVFIVTSSPNHAVQDYLAQNDGHGFHVASDGEYAFFYRPHHLPGIETPVSIANAALRNEPTGAPRGRHAEVVGTAKRRLEPGEELDGGGGYTVYGLLESADRADRESHVPLELLDGATVTTTLERDDVITYDDVTLEESFIWALREGEYN